MGVLHGPGFLPVPLEDRQVVLGPVRDHREVAHAAPIREEVALPLLDADGEAAPHARAILPMVPIVRDVGHLGPGPDGVWFLALDLPGRLWEAHDLRLELFRHIGADGVGDPVVLSHRTVLSRSKLLKREGRKEGGMAAEVRWGLVGLGRLVQEYLVGVFAAAHNGRLVAYAGRTLDRGKEFAATHGVDRRHGSYEEW